MHPMGLAAGACSQAIRLPWLAPGLATAAGHVSDRLFNLGGGDRVGAAMQGRCAD